MARPDAPLFLRVQWTKVRQMSTARQVTVVAVILIVAQVAFRSYFVSRSWFLVDDFFFLSDIAQGRDDLAWYFHLHQGHFMPLSFLLVKIASGFGAYPWAAAAVEIIAMQLAASVACWWMLRTVFGSRPLILLPLTIYLLTPLTVPAISWWAVAINQLPHQVAVFGAVAAHVTFARTHRRRWALLATLFLTLGFATYTKTLLLPVMLTLVSLLYFASGDVLHRIASVVRRQWFGLTAYAAVSVGFLVSYVVRLPPTAETGGSLYDLASTTVLSSFGTAAIGGPWRVAPFGAGPIVEGTPPDVGIVMAWLVLLFAVFWLWAHRERALRALVLPATYLLISIALVYTGRGFVLSLIGGVRVGQSIQYIGDIAPVLVLALALMMMPVPGAVESSTPRARPWVNGRPPRLLLAGAAAVLAGGAVVSTIQLTSLWNSNYVERAFTQRATASIAASDPVFADVAVPERIAPTFIFPRNLIREHFAPLGGTLRVATTGTDLSILDDTGNVVPAAVVGAPRTTSDPDGPCPYRVKDRPRTISFAPVIDFGLWIGVDYRATFDADILLTYGSRRQTVPIRSGQHTLFVRSSDAFDSITLTPLVGQNICVSAVRVGFITDRQSP